MKCANRMLSFLRKRGKEESENLKRINRALIDTADFVAGQARRGNFNDLLKEEMQKFGISESGSMTEQQEKKVILIIYMAFAREAARAAGMEMNIDVLLENGK